MNTYVEDGAMHKISLDCRFSDRSEMRWRDDLYSDWTALYSFIKSGLDPKAIPAESYKRLCDKGYVHNDRVMVTALIPKDGDDCREAFKRVITENVTVSDDIKAFSADMDRQAYERSEKYYPEHIKPIVKLYSTGILSDGTFLPYLIEEMIERGMLMPLNDIQKKSVFTVIAYKR